MNLQKYNIELRLDAWIVSDKGIRSKGGITAHKNSCCSFICNDSPIIPISDGFVIDEELLIEYESHFTRCATSLNGENH